MDAATQRNQRIYNQHYTASNYRHRSATPYDRRIVQLKLDLLRKYCRGKIVADLGCGSGEFLLKLASHTKKIFGIDFSSRMLRYLHTRIPHESRTRIALRQGDIQHLPFSAAQFDAVYSIATLYTIPDNARAIHEISRVLKSGGIAILDLGNLWSLNTLVVLGNPSGLHCYHLPVSEMRHAIDAAGFDILEHRVFQLLPMYGIHGWHQWYLIPFCLPQWKYLMGIRIGNRMIDEWVSSLPVVNRLAFRHLFVCRKRQ